MQFFYLGGENPIFHDRDYIMFHLTEKGKIVPNGRIKAIAVLSTASRRFVHSEKYRIRKKKNAVFLPWRGTPIFHDRDYFYFS